jgi:hypothetical protein
MVGKEKRLGDGRELNGNKEMPIIRNCWPQ